MATGAPRPMIDAVDPFIGTEVTDLPPSRGIAASWWWPKPQIGNTHPGATSPFGMVSACPYSGGYPTGYGRYAMATEGVPRTLFDRCEASGFTHFQQSGTGAIRKYYNYFRVTPMLETLEALDTRWPLRDEVAEPGYYGATLGADDATAIGCELTVGPKSAVHRYRFPAHDNARVVVDFSLGGLLIDHGRTVPRRAHLCTVTPGVAQGEIVVEGVPLAVHIEHDTPGWRQMLWYDRRLVAGGSRLEFDSIRTTTLRPFGLVVLGPARHGDQVELRMGFSLRGVEQARRNLHADCGPSAGTFGPRRTATRERWRDHLGRIEVSGGTEARRTVFASSLYHSMLKPCFAPDESPFWQGPSQFVFDICTMWDLYKTQLPLLTTLAPDRAVDLVAALVSIADEEGNFPIGYRMARGSDRFFRQASALAHTFLADVCALDLPGIDWDHALVQLHADLRRAYGEDYLETGIAHPVSHTLDIAYGYQCTAAIARHVGDDELAGHLEALATGWTRAFDPSTGLLVDSTFYEGGLWNYSFRLLHDMAQRVELAGGDRAFVALLDRFFGFGSPSVTQLGESPTEAEMAAGYALGRFEGLNNEPDMEAPWNYHYAGRPDRTAEVVRSVLDCSFGTGRGGLPGNDDSGGLSSWYVWASLGLFPVAGQGLFLLGAPSFEESRLRVSGGELVIRADGVDARPGSPTRYVRSAALDGASLERSWLTSSEVHAGGVLQVELGASPGDWGTTSRPPSHPTAWPEPPGVHRRRTSATRTEAT